MPVKRQITEPDGVYFITITCRGKWSLVNDVTEYDHSSARFYLMEKYAAYVVTNYLELDDIDLT